MSDAGARSGFLERIVRGAAFDPACIADIIMHLRVLLNTRRGSVLACPDYGVEDLADLLSGLPRTSTALCTSLRDTIERFEPRLTGVSVNNQASANPLIVSFQVSALLAANSRTITFRTRVFSASHIDVTS